MQGTLRLRLNINIGSLFDISASLTHCSHIDWRAGFFCFESMKSRTSHLNTPFAVFVGAFPGAIPPLLGYTASSSGFGEIAFGAWVLFAVQFMWQFPHFWAIAWVLDEDYKKAGFRMLPSLGGRDKSSAFQILVYTLFLLPISLLPVLFGMSGIISVVIISVCGAFFAYQAYTLYKDGTVEAARKLMFGSFIYLPVVQLAVMIGK